MSDPSLLRLRLARTLVYDHEAAVLLGLLADAGLDSVLLKGASFRRWLYPDGLRWHRDIDVLVDPAMVSVAERVLTGRGYRALPMRRGSAEGRWWWTGHPTGQPVMAELHWSLPRLTVAAADVWWTLSRHSEPMMLHDREVSVLDLPARCFHVALHAAQHGTGDQRTGEDLRRALAVTDTAAWQAARGIADRLDAIDYLAAGLSRLAEGRVRAVQLGLPRAGRAAVISLGSRTDSPGRAALSLQRVLDAPTARDRTVQIAQMLRPRTEDLRQPFGGGRLGLLATFARRLCLVVALFPAAVWRHLRAGRT